MGWDRGGECKAGVLKAWGGGGVLPHYLAWYPAIADGQR